ncbi:piezo-type mechanosensitive ion channel component 1-like isoform X1 [Acropora palmata]|uniref:piezo-type mechanosensitive ion channel component 1-like isoform X1 n=1 Tax=Acropora palmata TaxID=6131 RepID=UPI003DA10E80
MSSPVVCTFLFRWILPLVLLGACCFRINGFSLIYLCCLLAVPLLPNPSRAVTSTDHFQKALLGLSVVALTSQIVFQIVLGAFPPYGHFFPNCSTYERLTRQIGLSRFDGVPAIEVFRIIAPDVIVMAVAIICIVFYRGLIGISPLPPNTPRHFKMPSDSTTWDNVMPYFIAVMLLIAGIMLPSLASAIYFIIFLILGTMWACHKAFRLRRKKAFAYLRFTLMVYSGLHLVTLYLYQFQFFQASLPPEHLLARLFGLVGIVYTDCSAPVVLHVRLYLGWPDCASPCVILVLYWFLATETRFYFIKEDFHKYGESQTHWWGPPNWLHSSSLERQSLIGGPSQTNYNTLGPLPENVVSEEPVQPIREPDHEEYPGVQGTLGSIIMFLMHQSYIAALIIMMAWSITYHSWLTFVLLLWACVIWITPFARWCCMVSSPGLVIYAELLLLVQYVYGLQLTDDELPIQDPTGTFDYSELGLKKWQFPCLHVGAQTLFTWVFWVTLRQHIREKEMKRRERQNEESMPLRNLAHPFLKALRKMYMEPSSSSAVGSDEGDALNPKASDDATALMMWVKSVLAKYWILLCCGAFLLVGLQNEVSVYQIGYMAIFLFILICYQISIATWRLILRPLWWVMVIYSICILLLIYTYQFDNMPLYWHNATGLSDQWLYNLGLRQHTKASLLLELLTPTAFSIVIVIQLHFFHRPFLDMIDLRVRSSAVYQSTARGAVEPINEPSTSRQDDGELAGTPREPRMSTQKSFLVMALIKIVSFYNDLTVFLWRVGELHMLKLVNLTLICVVLYQVCAINAIIIILLGISMPSRVLQKALSYCFLIWSSLVILSKMIYQLRFVQADLFQHNCTDQTLPRPTSVNHFVNNALWVGFYKTDNISEDIKGYLLIVIVIVLHAVIKHHQKLYRWRHSSREPEPGILFPGITRPDADEGVVGCIKYLCNKFFFHFGWEVCLVVIVINMAVRCDITSVIYAIWLGAFLVLGRENSSVVWPVFVGFMAVLLPLQYLLVLGWPPALCLAYPWTNFLDANLVHWLYLTDVKLPPDPNHLLGDFFQLLFACCQESVFSVERFERSNEQHETSGTGSNSNRRSGRGHMATPDFMWNITWLDFFKVFVFQHMYWVTLAVVYITVQSTISIFNFGFILWCFFFLWHGQALYLQPRTRLFRLWKIFLGYNYFTLLAKVCLQLVSCVYVDYVKNHTGCWTLQLLSLFCLRQRGYKNKIDTNISDCVAPDDTGLAMDCACFTFLVIQYRVFTSDYFKHVVRDHREQSDMASRGAELVDDHVRTQLDAVRQEDKRKMDRIRKSLYKLKKKLARLHPEGEQYEPQSHYEAIYSGDYKWFESESEEDLENDSPTGSPAHERTPSPSEAEKPETETKDPEHKATVTEATEGAATSGDDGEEDFLEVVGPEVPSESGKPEGFVEKIKRWCSWVYYYIAVSLDRVIDLLNEVSKDYREIADQLKKERKEKRIEKLRRAKFGYWGSRARGEESSDPEMETKSMMSRLTMEDDDAWSVSNLDLEDVDGGANWRKSNMRISRLTIAFVYALLAHTDILCYMLMILNHMVYASVLSMPLPFLVFLWGLLSIPRPTKNFWITVITYTQIVIVVKYLFKFQFIDINDCNGSEGLKKSSPMCPPKLIGIERDGHTSAYDLLLLLVLFFHRYSLKVHGLWRDKGIEEESDGTDEELASPFSPQAGRSGSVILERSLSRESTISAVQQSQDVENVEGNHKHKNHESGLCLPVVTFFRRISDPEIGSGAVDVYAMMFACQFIIFIIIVFSWSAFSSPEQTPQVPQFMQIIEQNVVPKTFLYMLLSQFFLIVIDRFLYLRKFVIAKLVYTALLVILFHIFMFFIVPLVTQRPFISNVPAIFMYIFKCMYFGLSAYQVRCGYPTRILGNFLTKSYTLTSGILFQGFQAIPFLLELRSVLDWVCTDTTLTLYHWLKMEDIYANIYVLKCYRESEKTWVQPRGQKYWTLGKWGLGGLLVALLVIVIWFPLLFMSYINSVYASILPQDATFTLSIGGYQPLFKVSAQDKSLRTLSDDELDTLKEKRSRGFSETQWESFLLNYKGRDAVLQVKIVGNSSSIWTISPPSRDLMTKYLADNNVTLRFSYEFTREPKTALAQETISGFTQVSLDDRTKNQLADMLKGNSSSDDVVIKNLFPSFVGVPASGSVSAVMSDSKQDINYVTCRLRMRSKGSFDWWELTQMSPKPLFGAKENVLEMITFNDPVPPLHFSFFTSTGIIGLYVGFVWLVGKFVRLFFTSISYRIMFDEMPNVDKVLKLCLDIFMVRESKELALEEDLFAKLMFLYRSPQTLIKWTKYKRQ